MGGGGERGGFFVFGSKNYQKYSLTRGWGGVGERVEEKQKRKKDPPCG